MYKARCVDCVFQMWMSARSLLSPRASISVSTLWAPSAASVTKDTSCQDIAALVSGINSVGVRSYRQLRKSWELRSVK